MQDFLIYAGIGINIVGALFLITYAIKYAYLFHKTRQQAVLSDDLKPVWAKKRAFGFGLMIAGAIIVVIASLIK
ncbi:MAG: hypothetical protein J6B44_05555 [Muribaculaceae bacterium]|nr:hypothetical protein [Muribaculaceae bacterium]